MIRDRDLRDGLVVAIEHIEWALGRGFSLADIADSIGLTLGANPSLTTTAVLLATTWAQIKRRPFLSRKAA